MTLCLARCEGSCVCLRQRIGSSYLTQELNIASESELRYRWNVVNWEQVSDNYAAAKQGQAAASA